MYKFATKYSMHQKNVPITPGWCFTLNSNTYHSFIHSFIDSSLSLLMIRSMINVLYLVIKGRLLSCRKCATNGTRLSFFPAFTPFELTVSFRMIVKQMLTGVTAIN